MISRGILNEYEVIFSGYVVRQYDHRAKIFIVEKEGLPGLFVKQLKNTFSPMPYLLQKDATTLWNIKHESIFASLKPYSSSYRGFDVEHQTLITEYNNGFVNLEEFLNDYQKLDNNLLTRILKILCQVHIPFKSLPETPSFYFYPRSLPWVFEILSQDDNGSYILPHYAPIINEIALHTAFRKELKNARNSWLLSTFIHGDIKWTNFIISTENNNQDLKLVDWEMADIGDPIWDFAGLIHSILKDAIIKKHQLINEIFNNQETSSTLTHIYYVIDGFSQYQEQQYLGSPDIIKLLQFTMLRLIQSACELNEFESYLKNETIEILHAAQYMAEHLHELKMALQNRTITP